MQNPEKNETSKSAVIAPTAAVTTLTTAAAEDATGEDAAVGGFDPLQEFFVSESERSQMTRSFAAGGAKATVGSEEMLELLAFWVADEEYAVSIVEIQEIIKLPPITELPRAFASVLGIISLRGTIVPVLDLRRVLHLEERPMSRQTRILVVRSAEDPVGLLVDRVTSVMRFERDKIEATPHAMRRQTSEFVRGVGRLGSRFIIILEVKAVLAIMDAAA
jgi:purine-binding chemotaxis protein CheW